MMMRVAIFCFLLLGFVNAFAASAPALPSPHPVIVKTGFYLDDILAVDDSSETAHFVGTVSLQWHDTRLVHPGEVQRFNNDGAISKLHTIWNPHLHVVNIRGNPERLLHYLTIDPDGTVTLRSKIRGVFSAHLNLRHFPFDRQQIDFELEPYMYSSHEVVLAEWPQYQGVAARAHLAEWLVESVSSDVKQVATHYGATVSRYTFSMKFSREYLYYIWQVILPVLLIAMASFSVFWMVDNPLVNRVAISLTAVLTIVVFEWRVYERLPHVSYHTYIDVFMTFSFIVAGLTIPASLLLRHRDGSLALRWLKNCRWVFPAGYLLGALLIFALFRLFG